MKVQIYVHKYLGCLCLTWDKAHIHDVLFWDIPNSELHIRNRHSIYSDFNKWELIDSWDEETE